MKNKKVTYLLICFVAIIWGFFFYMLFSNNSPQTEQQVISYEAIDEVNDSIVFKKLNLSYNDPFLARSIVSKGYIKSVPSLNLNVKVKSKKNVIKKVKQDFVWPKVVYGGTLNGDKGLVSLNNRLLIVKEGQLANEFTVVNIYPDSIRISFKENTKVFLKNK